MLENSSWWVPLLGTLMTVLSTVVTYALTRFVSWIIAKTQATEAEQEVLQALLEGMARAQNEIVREAKTASADGKLTKVEIIKAEDLAINHAEMVLKGPAKEVFTTWSEARMSSIIKQLLAKFKGGKSSVSS